jgi:hypothetical protein
MSVRERVGKAFCKELHGLFAGWVGSDQIWF